MTPLRVASLYTADGNEADVLGTPLAFADLISAVSDTARERLTR